MTAKPHIGQIGLLGSGETAAAGGRLFEAVVQEAVNRDAAQPFRIAVLETPAGFELNSERVAGRVADYLRTRLGNFQPQVEVLAARRRGTAFSPDDPGISEPLLGASLAFAGPGSPTYAVTQLASSLTWHRTVAAIANGASAVFASAAAIAIGRFALPVYEIYKAGHDLHWCDGLDRFGPFGLSLAVVPHWNNTDGGAELDTSRCFMGGERFALLRAMLPHDVTIVGLDEHTGLVIDLERGQSQVMGQGTVTLLRGRAEHRFSDGETFPLAQLGPYRDADLLATLPPTVRDEAASLSNRPPASAPPSVLALADERQAARLRRDWAGADQLRNSIEALGWQVQDTSEGPRVLPRPMRR